MLFTVISRHSKMNIPAEITISLAIGHNKRTFVFQHIKTGCGTERWKSAGIQQVFTHFKTNAKTIGISRFQHDKIQEAFEVNCNVSFKTIVPLSILLFMFITKPLVKFNCSTPFSYNKEFHNNLSRTNIFSSHSLKARFDGQTRTDRRCFQSS